MKKYIALLLALVMALSLFAGCGKTEPPEVPETPDTTQTPETPETPADPEAPTEPEVQLTDEEILWARREAAEAYLREMASIRWRSDVTVEYKYSDSQTTPIIIEAGRLYEGLPYSYAGASLGAWLDHPGTMDEKGVYNMTGLNVDLLGGSSTSSRIGIDCSATLSHSWQSVGAQVRTESTNAMTEANGFIKVGEYEAPKSQYTSTKEDCQKNGQEVMFAAYSLLQKGDGIVTSNGSGHARFVVEVNVVKDDTGAIIGGLSTVKTIEKNATSGAADIGSPYFDEAAGEQVYPCLHVDREYSFTVLFQNGYLPVTNEVFVDPSPIEEPKITDTITEFNKESLLRGTISCNWALDNLAITITDKDGKVVQSSLMHPQRRSELAVNVAQFISDPASKLVGEIDLSALPEGQYHAVLTARTVAGHELTARDFDFTVEAPAVPVNPGDVTTSKELLDAAAAGGEIKLLSDIKLQHEIIIPKGVTVTLDLNGKTLSSDDGYIDFIQNRGTLTVIDSVGGGTFTSASQGSAGSIRCIRNDGGEVILNGGKFVAESNVKNAYVVYCTNGGTLTVNGATLEAVYSSETGSYNPYTIGMGKGTVIVNDGTVVSATSHTRSANSTAAVVVVEAAGASVTINGGTFTSHSTFEGTYTGEEGNQFITCGLRSASSQYDPVFTVNGGTFKTTGGQEQYPIFVEKATVNVTGGTFQSDHKTFKEDDKEKTITITGGKFVKASSSDASDISAFLSADYVQNSDGTVAKKN